MSKSKNLYIIAGCNGAGKTTASFNILPDILDCQEFINADEIAKGLSPFQPEKASFEAGRIMLQRIDELLTKETVRRPIDFAFETTLSSKTYKETIIKAQQKGYFVTLLFFWLNDVKLAKERVKMRVSLGGHDIPAEIIERRYERGIKNLFDIYLPICDYTMLFDNSEKKPLLVMESNQSNQSVIIDNLTFNKIRNVKS